MPKFVPIYEGRDFYVPAFNLTVNGKDLPEEASSDVIDVRYSDSTSNIDTFDLTVNNWDAEALDFKYTGPKAGGKAKHSEDFTPGQKIELRMGYRKSLQLMLKGKISKLTPSFPAAGAPTLKVSGQSVLSELSAEQKTFSYKPGLTASQIAVQVGERGNLRLDKVKLKVKPGKTANKERPLGDVLQYNQYDIVFLLQLAHRQGYDVLLKYEKESNIPYLLFGTEAGEPRVSYSLEWGKSLIQFQPSLTTSNQVKEVIVCGWDASKKKEIKVPFTRSDLDTRPLRDKKKLETLEEQFQERKEIVVNKPFPDEGKAKEYAKALLQGIVGKMVTGHGSIVGTPDLRAGSRIEIKNLGDIFSGTYTVTSTTHTINASGYLTEFEARLEEENR
jgi:phage protein D